ncbi:MAG: hypothetical protein L0H83_06160 [Salinisphaera sp.]|nr:hypothetical protein [Salinisphaera sp.]
MSRRRRNREPAVFGLSFLDAICCGFGAVVLLLVITKNGPPVTSPQRAQSMDALAAELRSRLPSLSDRARGLQEQLAAQREQLAKASAEAARLDPRAAQVAAERKQHDLEGRALAVIEQRLAAARQDLSAEMRRLYAAGVRAPPAVGGIPVDSEYIVFVIDTSGSMQRHAWSRMLATVRATLKIYPTVKGIQVLSDEGDYMYPEYAGHWIPDTPARRDAILARLAYWQPYSDSNPVEGIVRAIRDLEAPDKHVSVYVFGDEYTGGPMQQVLNVVERINPEDAEGNPRVRIHAIGFPTQFTAAGIGQTGVRFANLMRRLTEANGGTFVGLTTAR